MSGRAASASVDFERAEVMARCLARAAAIRRIFAADHPRTVAACQRLLSALHAYETTGRGPLLLTCSGGMLAHEGVPFQRTRGLDLLAREFEERSCGGLALRPRVPAVSVRGLVDWLADPSPHASPSLTDIEILPPGADEASTDRSGARGLVVLPEFEAADGIHRSAHAILEHVMDDVRSNRRTDFGEILELTRWTADEAFYDAAALVAPTQNPLYDSYTFNHSVNVFLIATCLLRQLAPEPRDLARLAQAALLHDVGKSLIPREILNKKGRLTNQEQELILHHPVESARILQQCPQAEPLAIEVGYCHHMRDHGHGYPAPSWPVKCGPVTDIVHVADMFESLTAHRPGRPGLTAAQAVRAILATPGIDSKRHAVALLCERLTCAPAGSLVRLTTGERGIVVRPRPTDPLRPLVRLLEGPDGSVLDSPSQIDLHQTGADGPSVAAVSLKPTPPSS